MVKILVSIILLYAFSAPTFGQNQMSADAVLKKTVETLGALKTIKYKYRRELNYPSEKYVGETVADAFFDFTSGNSSLGARFRFNSKGHAVIFNGSELFELSEKDKTLNVYSKPNEKVFNSSSYMDNSPITHKNLFPQLIESKTIIKKLTETTYNKIKVYVIEFSLENQWFDNLGRIASAELKAKQNYRITIKQNDFLPIEVLRKLNETDFVRTNLTDIDPNAAAPIESSWFYSTYLSEYAYAKPPMDNLIKVGATPPEINLPLFGSDKVISLNDYKGKLVLLNFWIFHCGYCQKAVPELNALQKKYKQNDFKLLTVNIYDSKDLIQHFINTKKSEFPILYNGEEAAKKFGVIGFPTVFLIGKDGKVIYSGNYDSQKLDDLISTNL